MKKSFLEEFKNLEEKLEKNGEDYNSHFFVGVDIEEDGTPNASIMMSHGTPFNTLGMVDLLIKNLTDIREEILEKLSTRSQKQARENVDNLIDKLPRDLREKIATIKTRMDDAMERGDEEELKKIKKEILGMKNPFKSDDDDDDDDDSFNINDFKGGMA